MKIKELHEASYLGQMKLDKAFVLTIWIEDFRGKHYNSTIEEAAAFDKNTLIEWTKKETSDPQKVINEMIKAIKTEDGISHKKRDVEDLKKYALRFLAKAEKLPNVRYFYDYDWEYGSYTLMAVPCN